MDATIVLLRNVNLAKARKPAKAMARSTRKAGSALVNLDQFFVG
jgi:hypothetical protein